MTEREALLQSVYANPADDLPRLVFTDWCDENGDPDRAEFIRLSIARWRTQEEKQYPRPMKARIAQLLAAHDAGWRAELPALAGVTWGRYWCGFVSEAQFASPAALVQQAAAAFAAAPVRLVLAAARPQSRLRKAHLEMPYLPDDHYAAATPPRLLLTGLGRFEPL